MCVCGNNYNTNKTIIIDNENKNDINDKNQKNNNDTV